MVASTSLTVRANDLDHHVLEWPARIDAPARARAARTVALLHGYMDAAGTWQHVAPVLAEAGFRVLAPDMRGFGEGARAPRGSYYHFVDYVFDLADLLDALSPGEPVAIVGHSMGGTIGTLYAGAFPERVARLATLEGLGPPEGSFEAAPAKVRGWIEDVRAVRAKSGASAKPMTREEALRRLAMNHPNVPRDTLAELLPRLVREIGPDRVEWRYDPLHRTRSPTPFFAKQLAEFSKRVTCPTLFVSGGPTGFHAPDEEARVGAFPDVRYLEIAHAGQIIHWTAPDELSRALLDFFSA